LARSISSTESNYLQSSATEADLRNKPRQPSVFQPPPPPFFLQLITGKIKVPLQRDQDDFDHQKEETSARKVTGKDLIKQPFTYHRRKRNATQDICMI